MSTHRYAAYRHPAETATLGPAIEPWAFDAADDSAAEGEVRLGARWRIRLPDHRPDDLVTLVDLTDGRRQVNGGCGSLGSLAR